MGNRAKRTNDLLAQLGFYVDDTYPGHRATAWRHANEPETQIKVYDNIAESAAVVIRKQAERIVGLGTSGNVRPATIKEREQERRERAKAQREREAEEKAARESAAQQAWEQRRQAKAEQQAIIDAQRRTRQMRDLMRPGYGR